MKSRRRFFDTGGRVTPTKTICKCHGFLQTGIRVSCWLGKQKTNHITSVLCVIHRSRLVALYLQLVKSPYQEKIPYHVNNKQINSAHMPFMVMQSFFQVYIGNLDQISQCIIIRSMNFELECLVIMHIEDIIMYKG